MYTIAVIKDRTTIYKKVPYDCLSYKQKLHNGILKYNINTNTKSSTIKAKPIDIETRVLKF
jgi:hypothetical protein